MFAGISISVTMIDQGEILPSTGSGFFVLGNNGFIDFGVNGFLEVS